MNDSYPPTWLIFKDRIINCSHIVYMERWLTKLHIKLTKNAFTISVSNIDVTWEALQKAFAEGVTKIDMRDTQATSLIQTD